MVTMSSEYSIYLYWEKVDLRKGISGLSGIVRDEMRLNPNTAKSVYVFSGRNFGRKSERNAGRGRDDDGPSGRGGNRESEKKDYVDVESQNARDAERASGDGSTVDIMRRIEERLEVFRKSDFVGCGELLKKALKYARGEWPAMKRVLECGDVELSNNLGEQMMRRIKMNLKNAGNIGSERSARHNAFMYSVIESCKMVRRNVEDYLRSLLERLRSARDGDDLTNCLPSARIAEKSK